MWKVVLTFFSPLLAVVWLPLVALSTSSLPKEPFFGISPQDEQYYETPSEIKCKDGSKKFRKSQLNDDFCDCADGTDEPGTSACPNGKFYCRNAGHSPQFLFSSRVNDGICDCCDGSDEYDAKVECPNTCWEAGKAARDKLKRKIATYKEGFELRKQEIEHAKTGLAKDEAELMKLKSEEKILKGLVQQLKDRKEQIEKAKEKEHLEKEKEEKESKEAELAVQHEKGDVEEKKVSDEKVVGGGHDDEKVSDGVHNVEKVVGSADEDTIGNLEDFHPEQHTREADEGTLSLKEDKPATQYPSPTAGDVEKKEPDNLNEMERVSEKTEELSREELGRLVASRWTGEKTEKKDEEADSPDSDQEDSREMSKNLHNDEDDGFVSEADDDTSDAENYDDHDAEDEADHTYKEEYLEDSSSSYEFDVDDDVSLSDTTTRNPSWLEKLQQTVNSILQGVNIFQTPENKSEADRLRKEYDESNTKLSKLQSRISSLENKLKQDFGPEKQFYSFSGRCFENKQNKYTYKVCPFKEASQVEGYSTTLLGQWDRFDDSYQVVIFSNGDGCWNGPDRSLKVRLRCGLKNQVMDVDEPSRCEYVAVLSTPAHCLENKLTELQQKLDLMNQELPEKHDEL